MAKNRTLDKEIRAILALEARVEEMSSQARERFDALRARIERGTTTGDDLKDVQILHWHDLSQEKYDALDALRDRFVPGTRVLLVDEEERPTLEISYMAGGLGEDSRRGLIPPPLDTVTEYHLTLGVLDEQVYYRRIDGVLCLPMQFHAETKTPRQCNSWQKVAGGMEIQKLHINMLLAKAEAQARGEKPVEFSMSGLSRLTKILVGDEVLEFFRKAPYLDGHLDVGYAFALEQVLDVLSPGDFRKAYRSQFPAERTGKKFS